MKLIKGNLILEKNKDITDFESLGFKFNWHTDYYLNGLTAEAFGITLGFYSWLDNLNCCLSYGSIDGMCNLQFKIKSKKDLNKVIKFGKSLIEISKLELIK